ncbi:MAG: dipicolinic acid synthetase subunit A, partial [Bacilli bacterium]
DRQFPGSKKVERKEIDPSKIDAILLPVSGMNAEGKVDCVFCESSIEIPVDWIAETPQHCKIYSGIVNEQLKELASLAKRDVIGLMDRDDVAIYNAVPTVEGTLMMCIQNTDITIHNSKVVVTGFGRVGMSVARVFHALGAKVSVAARKSEDLARIFELGFEPITYQQLPEKVKNVDFCINTVPHMVIDANVLSHMPLHTYVVDLASKPGGVDFRYADKRGIKAVLAPGLPGIVAPRTAGKILGKVLVALLQQRG